MSLNNNVLLAVDSLILLQFREGHVGVVTDIGFMSEVTRALSSCVSFAFSNFLRKSCAPSTYEDISLSIS